jgi:hypothetical protein
MFFRWKRLLPTTVLAAAACLAVLTVLPASNAAAGAGGVVSSATAGSFEVTATLDGRTAKDLTNHAFPNLYIAGQYVPISCQASGAAAYGSTVWDLTKDHVWIPDYYVRTGSSGFSSAIVRCGSQPTSSPGGFDYSISATLDGRTAKDTANHAYPNKYLAGSTVTVTCQAYGLATGAGCHQHHAEHPASQDHRCDRGCAQSHR